MKTECKQTEFEFQGLARRKVEAKFDGGMITSDAGGLLLREVEQRFGIIERFADCFTDHRDQELIEHTTQELVAQRIYGLALGYEDLADHDDLRHDRLPATLVGKQDPTGGSRLHERDRGKPLAGKSTLNRLELTPENANASARYKKVVAREEDIERFFVDVFLSLKPEAPERIVLDLDATDDPLHGEQEGRFFHSYYDCYCYLPLYIFCGHDLLCAKLRPAAAPIKKCSPPPGTTCSACQYAAEQPARQTKETIKKNDDYNRFLTKSDRSSTPQKQWEISTNAPAPGKTPPQTQQPTKTAAHHAI